MSEIGAERLLEGTAKEHCSAGVFLLPAVEITMPVPSRAAEVMRDLGVAVDHDSTFMRRRRFSTPAESSSHWLAGAKPSRLSREVPFMTVCVI